jgi:putative transposase
MEYLVPAYYTSKNRIQVPCLGSVRARGRDIPDGQQRVLRIIHRATEWYAQVLVEDGKAPVENRPIETAIGVDVGLTSFATLSDGTKIENPRWTRKSERKLRAVQRRVSRRTKGSNRWRKAVNVLRRVHERVSLRRRNFCHKHSTALVCTYDLIAVEKLGVAGMSRSRLGKSILDAAWSTFFAQLASKVAYTGGQVIEVNPRGTSQECPDCGVIAPKTLSERTHSCSCGLVCDRDHASARVILARALAESGATRPLMDSAYDRQLVAAGQADRMTRAMSIALPRT